MSNQAQISKRGLSWNNAKQRSQEAVHFYACNDISLIDCAKKFDLAYSTLSKYLNEAGFTKDSFRAENFDFFEEIETEEQAYWLGFILADGCITRGKVSISLARIDEYHLEKFKKHVNWPHDVWRYEATAKGKKYECSNVTVSSKKMTNDLARHNIFPAKSMKEIASDYVPKHLASHYIRGIFDGDGWISSYTRMTKGSINPTEVYEFGIGSSKAVLEYVLEQFYRNTSISEKRILPYKSIYRVRVANKKDLRQIFEYLYKDSTLYLERKREIAEVFLINKTEVSVNDITSSNIIPQIS